jgi:very-short-patch-repair endonuclease
MLRMTEEQLRERLRKQKGGTSPAKGPRKTVTSYARVLARQISEDKRIPRPIVEYSFDAQIEGGGRAWRFDLCWPDLMIGLEIDGGAHGIRRQLNSDIEKYQKAFELNYRVLRVSPEQVKNGEALKLVRKVLG